MSYEWENEVRKTLSKIKCKLPDGLEIVGFAVANIETGEGALLDKSSSRKNPTLLQCDYWQDIMGDAEMIYNGCMVDLRGNPINYKTGFIDENVHDKP